MDIIFTVSNDLSYDQRMQRICHSLVSHGYGVLLVGRSLPHSIPLNDSLFQQKRLFCFFKKGFGFYAEYNLRLFIFLLFRRRYDAVCSIDLDTLAAGFAASLVRRKKRVFDAHEYFSQVPEVVDRPFVRGFWEKLASLILPFYRYAYTVGPALAAIFEKKYGVKFRVVRNMARCSAPLSGQENDGSGPKILLYQGALNEGRGLETALMAMQNLENIQFVVAGEGDLSLYLRQLSRDLNLGDKVRFLGFVAPQELENLTRTAWLSLNLLENRGLSYYYSLANKFFDSVQAEVPVLTMDFPEYRALNEDFEVALLLPALDPELLVRMIEKLLNDKELYEKLRRNCHSARSLWNWEQESQTLLAIWDEVRRGGAR